MSTNATTASLDIEKFLWELDENLDVIRTERKAGKFSDLSMKKKGNLLLKLEKIEGLGKSVKGKL